MSPTEIQLIKKYQSGEIEKNRLVQELSVLNGDLRIFTLDVLKDAFQKHKKDYLNYGMCLFLLQFDDLREAGDPMMDAFAEIICGLLLEDWHFEHENMAAALKTVTLNSTIDCLYQAIFLKLEYLYYDDTFQFGRKCIKALSAIGNPEAIEKLKQLSKNENDLIKNYALKELSRNNVP